MYSMNAFLFLVFIASVICSTNGNSSRCSDGEESKNGGACAACKEGFFRNGNMSVCRTHSTCGGAEVKVEGNSTHDTVCHCVDPIYSDYRDGKCFGSCPPGKYFTAENCSVCPDNTWKNVSGSKECFKCTQCSNITLSNCTSTHDAVCALPDPENDPSTFVLTDGAKAGIGIACILVAAVAIVGIGIYCCKRKSRKASLRSSDNQGSDHEDGSPFIETTPSGPSNAEENCCSDLWERLCIVFNSGQRTPPNIRLSNSSRSSERQNGPRNDRNEEPEDANLRQPMVENQQPPVDQENNGGTRQPPVDQENNGGTRQPPVDQENNGGTRQPPVDQENNGGTRQPPVDPGNLDADERVTSIKRIDEGGFQQGAAAPVLPTTPVTQPTPHGGARIPDSSLCTVEPGNSISSANAGIVPMSPQPASSPVSLSPEIDLKEDQHSVPPRLSGQQNSREPNRNSGLGTNSQEPSSSLRTNSGQLNSRPYSELWDYEDCITRNHNAIYVYLLLDDFILSSLLQKEAFTHPQMLTLKEIKAQKGNRAAIDQLIILLRLHGNEGFENFIEALVGVNTKLDHLAKVLHPELAQKYIDERDKLNNEDDDSDD